MYTQSGERIEVYIHRPDGGSLKGANTTESTEKVDKDRTDVSTGEQTASGNSLSKRFVKVNVTHGLAVAKQVGQLSLQYVVSGLGYKYGDAALQETVSRQLEIVSDTSNVASGIAMGATYGAAGGPLGAALGAVFGAVSTIAPTISKYANRDRDYDAKIFKQNNAIAYQRARANLSLTTGRLR